LGFGFISSDLSFCYFTIKVGKLLPLLFLNTCTIASLCPQHYRDSKPLDVMFHLLEKKRRVGPEGAQLTTFPLLRVYEILQGENVVPYFVKFALIDRGAAKTARF
jgi:hypothetical protein